MKKIVYFILFFFINTSYANAANGYKYIAEHSQNVSLGFQLNSFANNFGFGVVAASPRFANDVLYFQLNGDVAWVAGVQKGEYDTSWTPYGMLRLGIFSGNFIGHTQVRIYGGGGIVLIVPSDSLSSVGAQPGAYALTGIEGFVNPIESTSVFVEFGGMGTGASANRLAHRPIFANGFLISCGFKYYF